MYARYVKGVIRRKQDVGTPVAPSACVSFVTFFNAFSYPLWREETRLERVFLHLHGRGDVGVGVITYTSSAAGLEVKASNVQLTPDGVLIGLPVLSKMLGEVIVVCLFGLAEQAALTSAAWTTDEPAKHRVALAARNRAGNRVARV